MCRAREEEEEREEECRERGRRRRIICEEGVRRNPYGDDDYMQNNKREKVGIKDKEKKNFRVDNIIIQEIENSSATATPAPLPHSDFFKV